MRRNSHLSLVLALACPLLPAQEDGDRLQRLIERESNLAADDDAELLRCVEDVQDLLDGLQRSELDRAVDLLGRLTQRLQRRALRGKGGDAVRTLHAVYSQAKQLNALKGVTHHRRRAEVALLANDLAVLYEALNDGVGVVSGRDDFEWAILR
ncbi:MAG: hypothetical protein AAF196_21140, partial [Planctomycetota bacterium]